MSRLEARRTALAAHYQMWDSYIKSRNPDEVPDLVETMNGIMFEYEGARLQTAVEQEELCAAWSTCHQSWCSAFDTLPFRTSKLAQWQLDAVYLQLIAIRSRLIRAMRLGRKLEDSVALQPHGNSEMHLEIEQAAQRAIEKIQASLQ